MPSGAADGATVAADEARPAVVESTNLPSVNQYCAPQPAKPASTRLPTATITPGTRCTWASWPGRTGGPPSSQPAASASAPSTVSGPPVPYP